MQFKDEAAKERFEKWRTAQTTDYGKVVFIFAERWAEGMEGLMERMPGVGIGLISRKAECGVCDDLNIGSMSGYSYGCAVAVLADVWKRGEELRCWHNLDPTNPASQDPKAVAEADDHGETLVFCGLKAKQSAVRLT